MKVGLIAPGFSADAADWCIPVLVDAVRELGRQVELHVFALRYPYRRAWYELHGAQVHALGGGETRDAGRAALLARACRALIAESRRGRFDVLHALWADEPGAVAVTAGRLLRTPTVVSVMGGELVGLPDIGYGGQLSWSGRILSTLALRAGDRVTAGCDRSVELAIRALEPEGRAKVVRLPWGVDPGVFEPATKPVDLEGTLRLLHVGSLVPVKDQTTLLRALARLRASNPGAHLHLAGDGPLRSVLCRQASELGLAGSVTFHGHVPRHHLPGFYRAADLLVLSSRFESQAVVVLEAALCNLPTIGTDVGLIADFAPEAAIAVPVGDDAGLAAAVASLRDGKTRRSLTEAARRRAHSEGLAAQTAGRLVELYRELGSRSEDAARASAAMEGSG
jgi:glycosyltransferase involved in cell wall biosynthesis